MRRISRQFEGPAPGRRTRRAAVAGCLSAVALGAGAAPALAVDPDVFSDNPNAGTTLREAIAATPAGGTITLRAGTYEVSQGDAAPFNSNTAGDLDVNKALTIVGAGIDQTIIKSTNPGAVDGVIHVGSDTLTLSDVTITGGLRPSNNVASADARGYAAGGGIRVGTTGTSAGNLVATRVKIAGNRAYRGAGVFVSGAPSQSRATLTDSIITGNRGSEQGGGIALEGVVTLDRSAVLVNEAAYGGGIAAFVNPRGELTATNTTIGANTASQNGGGIISGGFLNFDFVTLANNMAKGGRNILFAGGGVTVSNSIIAGSADNSCSNNAPGDIISGGFNIDQGATCITPSEGNGDRINVPATGDGGINLMPHERTKGIYYYGLAQNSAAKDAASELCFQEVDQRNLPRPQGPRCDIGAVEQQAPAVVDVGVESFIEEPDPATAGDEVTYEAVVRSIGSNTANDVVLKMSVPDTTTFVSASSGCSRPRNDALRCEIGALAPDQAATIMLTVKTTTAGTLRNRADVSAKAGEDVNRGNDRMSTTAEVQPFVEADPKVTIGLVKAVKRTAKKLKVRVGVNRANATAQVSLFTRRHGTLVLKRSVRFEQAGTRTIGLKLNERARRKIAKLKVNTKLQVRVAVSLANGDDLKKRLRLKINKKGRIVAV